jgi:prophage regulatory protein
MSSTIPATGFVRLKQILGDAKAEPPIVSVIPVCKAAWWKGVKAGTYPPPIKLGPNTTVWRAEDIHKLIAQGKWTSDEVVA